VFADIGLPLGGMGLLARRLALARAAQQAGVATLLRGDGGNRTLTAEGDEVFRHLFLSGRWWRLGREIIGTARYQGQSTLHVLRTKLGREIASRPLLGLWRRLRGPARPAAHDGTYLRPDFARDSGLEEAWERAPNRSDRLDLHHAAALEPALLQIHPPSADAAILLYARMGLENCAPFRDRRMVDFILSLPVEQLRRNGVPRFFARRVLADRLPAETLAETGYFPHFADCEDWLAGWWDDAAARLAEQHPADLAAAAIDLPRLRERLAMGPPTRLPAYGAERLDCEVALPQALHLNEFLRWHAGANR
jgi:asparagine synthase (glutamine-hydrolysing)